MILLAYGEEDTEAADIAGTLAREVISLAITIDSLAKR
jgi:hypothetical protein